MQITYKMNHPNFLIVLLFLCLVQDILPIPHINLLDEVLMLVALIHIIANGAVALISNKIDKIFLSVCLIIITQVVNYLSSPFSNDFLLGLVQSFIHIKAFLVLYLSFLYTDKIDYKKISCYFYFSFFLISFGLIVNLILGESWHNLLGLKAKYRDGMIRPISIFENTANLGYFFALTSSVFFITSKSFHKKGLTLYTALFLKVCTDFLLMHIITVRKLIIGVFPVVFMVFRKEKVSNKFFVVQGVILSSLALFLVLKDSYIYEETLLNLSRFNSDDHYYIRGLMFYYGVNLFIDFFPFGSGAGTFGTIVSTINTLDVYSYVGLDLGWLVNDSGKFVGIFDNGIGSYLGENGFIGLISLVYFLVVIYQRIRRKNKEIAYLVFSFTVLTSFIGPAWQDGVYAPIISLIYLFGMARSRNEKNTYCN